jgi:hypothetical protein
MSKIFKGNSATLKDLMHQPSLIIVEEHEEQFYVAGCNIGITHYFLFREQEADEVEHLFQVLSVQAA